MHHFVAKVRASALFSAPLQFYVSGFHMPVRELLHIPRPAASARRKPGENPAP
jgi:hypothetical protein